MKGAAASSEILHYLNKISIKRCLWKIAFLELSSWQCCFLHKSPILISS